MTNQTIPPCPACGVVPIKHAKNDRILLCGCFEEYGAMMADVVSLQKYQLMCVDILGRACRELGIETVEQLRALAKGAHCIVCDNDSGSYGGQYWNGEEIDVTEVQCEWCFTEPNSIFNRRRIAAQRGEGDGE